MIRLKSLLYAAAVAALTIVPGSASANPLGIYNLLVFGNVNGFNSDVEGSVAIGGSAMFTNYSVGDKANPADTNLVVGGSIQAVNGTTYGNSVIGGASSYTGWTTTGIQYPAGTASPIDFAAEQTRLTTLSTYLSTLTQSGTVTDQWGTLSLTATSDFNLFDISAATFSGTNTLNINASANSTVMVNIAGAAQAFRNMGISLSGGVTAGNIVYNFYEADQLTISGIGVMGSVLAPKASVLGSSSQILGQLVAANFSGENGSTTQVNRFDFRGTLPMPTAVPEPASWTMMILGFGAVGAILRRTGRRRAVA